MILNVRIARSYAFIMCTCGGDNWTTVLLFYNNRFSAVDASLSLMLNFDTCPTVSNV